MPDQGGKGDGVGIGAATDTRNWDVGITRVQSHDYGSGVEILGSVAGVDGGVGAAGSIGGDRHQHQIGAERGVGIGQLIPLIVKEIGISSWNVFKIADLKLIKNPLGDLGCHGGVDGLPEVVHAGRKQSQQKNQGKGGNPQGDHDLDKAEGLDTTVPPRALRNKGRGAFLIVDQAAVHGGGDE